jgi:hypothetical protein
MNSLENVLDRLGSSTNKNAMARTRNIHKLHLNYSVCSRLCQNCTAVSRRLQIEGGFDRNAGCLLHRGWSEKNKIVLGSCGGNKPESLQDLS